jgi:hypothetical protein
VTEPRSGTALSWGVEGVEAIRAPPGCFGVDSVAFEEALEYYDQTGQQEQAAMPRWHMGRARKAAERHEGSDNANGAGRGAAGSATAS